jgi:hypothetical protein
MAKPPIGCPPPSSLSLAEPVLPQNCLAITRAFALSPREERGISRAARQADDAGIQPPDNSAINTKGLKARTHARTHARRQADRLKRRMSPATRRQSRRGNAPTITRRMDCRARVDILSRAGLVGTGRQQPEGGGSHGYQGPILSGVSCLAATLVRVRVSLSSSSG